MSANESELVTSEHINVPNWNGMEVVELIDEFGSITEEEIDEILNGHAELTGREEVEPTYENLLGRYAQSGQEAYNKKMRVFQDSIEEFMPEDAYERDIEAPLQLQYWNNEEESYNDVMEKKRHHYIGYYKGKEAEEGMIFHYEWTTLETVEE